MQTHYRTRLGQRVALKLRDGTRLTWHFTRERSRVIEFAEGTIEKRAVCSFVPLSRTKCAFT